MRAVLVGACMPAFVAAVAATWLIGASRLFVLIGGLGHAFPDPYFEWWAYARQPGLDRWSGFYLVASGVIAGLPAIGVVLAGSWLVAGRYRFKRAPLYGETGWAGAPDMRRGGISTERLPF
jgi:hypothetical protein